MGKERPRTVTNQYSGKTHTYTPERTKDYESLTIQCYKLSKNKEKYMQGEPLVMTVVAYFDIPKSTTKKDKEAIALGAKYPTKKPDADNIGKIIADALNGVAYKDDTQIVRLFVFKEYTESAPHVKVKIRKLEEKDRMQAAQG